MSREYSLSYLSFIFYSKIKFPIQSSEVRSQVLFSQTVYGYIMSIIDMFPCSHREFAMLVWGHVAIGGEEETDVVK